MNSTSNSQLAASRQEKTTGMLSSRSDKNVIKKAASYETAFSYVLGLGLRLFLVHSL